MAQKKKLQVFISSTYTDLQEERQAAVQAILTAGHIPAGMELFAAGDETQMNVIKRWIDESDVYMLILGGRYGSIEPKSGKSYIHLEYDYALEKNKPLFAVVIDEGYLEEKVKKDEFKAIEKDHSEKLKEFRDLVCSKMVRFWKDAKDIKLSIMETMAEFSNREALTGWIPGNETINTGTVAEELARLAKENSTLRDQIDKMSNDLDKYYGLTFEEIYTFLIQYTLNANQVSSANKEVAEKLILFSNELFENKDRVLTLLQILWVFRASLSEGIYQENQTIKIFYLAMQKLIEFGLIQIETRQVVQRSHQFYVLSEVGKRFLLRLRLNKNFTVYDRFLITL